MKKKIKEKNEKCVYGLEVANFNSLSVDIEETVEKEITRYRRRKKTLDELVIRCNNSTELFISIELD